MFENSKGFSELKERVQDQNRNSRYENYKQDTHESLNYSTTSTMEITSRRGSTGKNSTESDFRHEKTIRSMKVCKGIVTCSVKHKISNQHIDDLFLHNYRYLLNIIENEQTRKLISLGERKEIKAICEVFNDMYIKSVKICEKELKKQRYVDVYTSDFCRNYRYLNELYDIVPEELQNRALDIKQMMYQNNQRIHARKENNK